MKTRKQWTRVSIRWGLALALVAGLVIQASCGSGSGTGGSSPPPTSNPVPGIVSLSPSSATIGSAAQTLTINGTNFMSSSTVTYNGVAHTATFVSSTQLTIPLTASDLATAGTYAVVVTNPTPGGGASNSVNFTVNQQAVNNTQPVQVNAGPPGLGYTDTDLLFTSVTICVPGTSNCQTIPDVQVDTGSEGLRILASELTLSLPGVNDSSGSPLGNCVTFADNSYVWGPVESADVKMAGEKASSVPIQIIGDTHFPAVPLTCNSGGTNDDTVPALGANGLLGVGVFRQDCGSACSGPVSSVPTVYFSCPSSGCALASVPLAKQLQNPVWMFGQDNNGLLITMPAIPEGGAATSSGSMIFGIATQSDNALGSAKTYTTDSQGNFTTTFQSVPYSGSFIDSGSNGLFFLDSPTTGISSSCTLATGFYCPDTTQNLTASNTGANGTSGSVSFSIESADVLFEGANTAFDDLGGPNPGSFDWGLPFFFGRTVFVGIESQTSPAGTGPYWAY
jgi:Protein of unknown function (DUF3443)